MDGAKKLVKVWALVIASLCYCFFVGKLVPKGIKRLLLVAPVVFAFFLVPLHISSVHFGGITAFFVAWLANFKLLLFAFGRGPLSPDPIPHSLPIFLAVSCLPIKIRVDPDSTGNDHDPSRVSHLHTKPKSERGPDGTGKPKSREGPLNYTIKALLLVLFLKAYDYSERMPRKAVLALYALHVYFILELILAAAAAGGRATLGLELEPQFKEAYLATSLQDFWGRRWNLMVSSILRPTVYEPSLRLFSSVLGKMRAPLPAVFSTFVVSALMHELIFYYMGRLRPAWELTWFFLIHGICTTVEIAVKKAIGGRWRFPTAVARMLTVGFVMATALWLFLPEFERCKIADKAFEEYKALGAILDLITQGLLGSATATATT
ncbi:PREDICTED: acyl-CoA--sterol O-acyltransferase 1 [Tarenaya hassleriana]|uniref:acyl-CoA--sterol O-acyltransferase 1 n=1 Tax=Tarenaya hassleriana TaxID=28532 RepID=UPI00053C5ED7|nr:PREDICTED: acyl-CoA--sterol O-acyltransferase 1 [Tarenaya hassleriana]